MSIKTVKNLKKNGIIKTGTIVKNGDILIGKVKEIKKEEKSVFLKILNEMYGKIPQKDISFKFSKNLIGTVNRLKILKKKSVYCITIYILEERKIKVGDKISGRHGNKGIIAKIAKVSQMPYLQDGTILEILLNPLGIPSRMNVGQLYECFLGMAGHYLKEKYYISQFGDNGKNQIFKTIIYNKLYEASKKSRKEWLFLPNYPGKSVIFDGITGSAFKYPIATGYSYLLKLMHLVDDKLTARVTGSYALITKQPVKGKAKNGGQRIGEMEIWALEGYGAAYTLQELVTIKSDDLKNRSVTLNSLFEKKSLPKPHIPETFKNLILELQCLCLDIKIYKKDTSIFF